VVGEFACHVYIPVALPPAGTPHGAALSAFLAAAVCACGASSATTTALHAAAFGGELHLSLSRTVPIRLPQVPTLTVRPPLFAFLRFCVFIAPHVCSQLAALCVRVCVHSRRRCGAAWRRRRRRPACRCAPPAPW
jgi:hypothetical protein